MRFFALFLFVLSVFAFSEAAHAYTYDDSVVIEIGDVPPPQPTNDSSTSGTASDTGGSGTTDSGGGTSGSTSPGTSGTSGNSDTSSFGTGSNGPTVSSGTSSGSETIITATLFDVLTASGAITEESGGSGTDQGQGASQTSGSPDTGTNSVQSDGSGVSDSGGASGNASGGGGTSGGGSGTITIDGARVRETLLGKLSFKDILDDHAARVRGGFFGNALSNRDIGLMAASTIIGDSNIDEVSFGATRFEIVYRSQGYVLGFIPKSFAARISVNPQAVAFEPRVNIALPWYRFLLRKLFNTTSLAQEIDAIVKAEGSPQEGESAADIKVRLFTDISQLLKKKVGTIGVPAQANQ